MPAKTEKPQHTHTPVNNHAALVEALRDALPAAERLNGDSFGIDSERIVRVIF